MRRTSESYKQVRSSQAHLGIYLSYVGSFLLYEHMEGSVYGFRVKGVEVANGAKVTEIAEKAGMSEMAKKAKGSEGIWMTTRHVIWPIAKKGVWMTTRHVICLVAKMAKVSVMTARHVICSLGKVAV
jgi:hypothetical protein